VVPHFTPDVAPTGTIGARLVHELGDLGISTDVVTALPWYAEHRVDPAWRGAWRHSERTDFGTIRRLHPFPTGDKSNIPARAVGFAAFCVSCAATGSVVGRTNGRVDAVLAMTPPLPMAATGWMVAAARRAPLVLNVQDVFPDVAVELGVLTNPRVVAAASALERWSYARAAAITVLSEDMRANLARKTDPARLHVLPNYVDAEVIRPGPRMNPYRAQYGLGERTVVMYAGNVGMSQSVDLLVRSARELAHRPDLVFVINGTGAGLAAAQKLASGLDNVVFAPLQPMERLPEVLAAADLHVVPLRTGLARSSVPSKIYSVLGAGRAVLASVDPGSEIERIVRVSGAGVAVPPEDAAAFTRALTSLVDQPDRLPALGAAGRTWVEREITPQGVARRYADLLEDVARRHHARPRGGHASPRCAAP